MRVKDIIKSIGPSSTVIMCGLPATGKSTLARVVSDFNGHTILSTDLLRLKVYDRKDVLDPKKAKDPNKRYYIYELMLKEAKALQREGRGVILDGTFFKQELRVLAINSLRKLSTNFFIFQVFCDENLALERIRRRQLKEYESNALTEEAYFNNLAQWEDIRLNELRAQFPDVTIKAYLVQSTDSDPLLWAIRELE